MAVPLLLLAVAGVTAGGTALGYSQAEGNTISEKVGNLWGQITGGLAAGGIRGGKEGIKAFLQEFGIEEDQMAAWTEAIGDAFFSVIKDIMDGGDFTWGDIGDMNIEEVIAHNKGQFWDELLSNAKNQGLDIDVDATVEGIAKMDEADVNIPGRQGLIDALQSDDISLTPGQMAILEQLSGSAVSQGPVSKDFEFESASEAVDSALSTSMLENYGIEIDADNIRKAQQELASRGLESGVDLDEFARKAMEGSLEASEIHMLQVLNKEGQTHGITEVTEEHFWDNFGLTGMYTFFNGRDVNYEDMYSIYGFKDIRLGASEADGAILYQQNKVYGDTIEQEIQEQFGVSIDMDKVVETKAHYESQGLSTGMDVQDIAKALQRGELSEEEFDYLRALEHGPEAFQEQSWWNVTKWGDSRDVEPKKGFEPKADVRGQLSEEHLNARIPNNGQDFAAAASQGAPLPGAPSHVIGPAREDEAQPGISPTG